MGTDIPDARPLPFIPDVATGDVFACYGDGWVSKAISWLTPRWRFWRPAPSHVAIVAKLSPDGVARPEWYVTESTTLAKKPDALDGTKRRGVQAHRLLDWLAAQAGRVDLYRLKAPMSRPGEFKCVSYLLDLHARKVGYSERRAIHTASPVRNTATGKYIVCSELVAYALQKGGSIGTNVDCCEVTPWDVARFPCFQKPVRVK